MKEPVVIINGMPTQENKVIPYTGVMYLDVEIFKTELMKDIINKIRLPYGYNIVLYIVNNISIEAYKYVYSNGTNNTRAILSLASMIHYQLQFAGIYVSVNDIIDSITSHVSSNSHYNHQ